MRIRINENFKSKRANWHIVSLVGLSLFLAACGEPTSTSAPVSTNAKSSNCEVLGKIMDIETEMQNNGGNLPDRDPFNDVKNIIGIKSRSLEDLFKNAADIISLELAKLDYTSRCVQDMGLDKLLSPSIGFIKNNATPSPTTVHPQNTPGTTKAAIKSYNNL